ncbi:uncharacterized protein LOC108745139 [Agrilus planipennis]|uniref:Uncharacterized protein LOC108745139 n=1 Tax=Agrilus planipennis TaxID=224129 RepID=A0A1W4XKU2_AGRPL|nr:uncharacterized protein LOC108745139 [Agrilus planipennis]
MGVDPNTPLGNVRGSVGPPLSQTTTVSSNIVPTVNKTATATTTISPREQIKIEFYRTYDVMTGIRIAATLGGFFSLMVILIVYKSKSKTDEALKDPKLAAAAVAEAEEEEQRQIQAVVEATLFEQLHPNVPRGSIDLSSLPASWARTARRFSSIGGYSSLLERRSQFSSQLPSFDDEESAGDEEKTEYDDELTYNRCLDVPRRPSNITCSSSGSSYLERRSSSILLGLPTIPIQRSNSRRRQSSPVPEQSEFYYPIDIRVIQPTPRGSPCSSERTLFNTPSSRSPYTTKKAPLASISSCNTSLSTDYPDFDANSFYSDVFQDDSFVETEDEAENFSTDSDFENDDKEDKIQKKTAAMKTWKEKRKRFAAKWRTTSIEDKESFEEKSPVRRKKSACERPSYTTPYLSVDFGIETRRLSASCVESNKRPKFSRRRTSLNDKPFGPSYKFLSIDRQPSLDERKINLTSSFDASNKSVEKLNSRTPSVSDKATNVSESKLVDAYTCVDIVADDKDQRRDPSSSIDLSKSATKRHSSLSLPSSCKSSVSLLSPMTSEESATVTLPTLPLRQRSSSTNLEKRANSWSQETLF